MKKLLLSFFIVLFSSSIHAQEGHEIKINLKNCNDTLVYLTFYQFDKNMIADTCKNIKNGKIIFKGKKKLEKGVYSLVSQAKSIYFDFYIDDENQTMTLNSDLSNNASSDLSSPTSKRENDFFEYVKYINTQKKEFNDLKIKTKGMTKADSTAFMTTKQKKLNDNIVAYEEHFYEQNKGTFIGEVLNLKIEKVLKEIPKASNGRPDSVAVFNYYKNHYWDNVDFKNDGLIRSPFFAPKLKRYFENLVTIHPDSVSVEVDRILSKTAPNSIMYKLLLAHFTSTYETSKLMGFDKVFVHISDTYFKTGKANELYNDDNIVKNIINRADLLRPILLGKIAPDIPMIPIEEGDKIAKMGFESAKTSEEATKIFYANNAEIQKTFLRLHSVQADFLILVFWDVDCGHCQTEIPKLLEVYHDLLKENKNVKVFGVYTQHDIEKYKKYVADKKLDWINVYDGAHYTDLKTKYDIYSTPVIYLLDKNKTIKAKRIGVEQIKDIIKVIENEDKE